MKKGRGPREGPLIVRRGFLRSRHEMDFAAVAYELVVPIVARRLLSVPNETAQVDRSSLMVGQTVRRPA
jgi:hypothetical protein